MADILSKIGILACFSEKLGAIIAVSFGVPLKKKGQRASRQNAKRDILFAVLGMSPAVITETVWALAHQKPAIIPQSIFVITTSLGYAKIKETLFETGVWDCFVKKLKQKGLPVAGRLQFGPAHDHIRLLPRCDRQGDVNDVLTRADSEAAADCILRFVREFAADPDTRIIASIAGGRKTMSALLMSCMILLGREQDMVCHVLVSPPYDDPHLEPLFLYPGSGTKHRLPGNRKSWPSNGARIDFVEIPFVRMRAWYERDFFAQPTSYMELVQRVQRTFRPPVEYPPVTIDMLNGRIQIGGESLKLSAGEFALFCVIARRVRQNRRFLRWQDLEADLTGLRTEPGVIQEAAWHVAFRDIRWDWKEDTRKRASRLRRKLGKVLRDKRLVDALFPTPRSRSDVAAPYPSGKIVFRK